MYQVLLTNFANQGEVNEKFYKSFPKDNNNNNNNNNNLSKSRTASEANSRSKSLIQVGHITFTEQQVCLENEWKNKIGSIFEGQYIEREPRRKVSVVIFKKNECQYVICIIRLDVLPVLFCISLKRNRIFPDILFFYTKCDLHKFSKKPILSSLYPTIHFRLHFVVEQFWNLSF